MSFLGGSIIKGFDWEAFEYLLDFGGKGATNSALQFFVDYSFTIAFVLGMVALCFSIIKIMSSQNPDIPMLILKFFLTMALIFYYEPLCKSAINYADDFAQSIVSGVYEGNNYLYKDMADEAYQKRKEIFQKVLGEDDLSEDEKEYIEVNKGFNPYRINILNFNILEFLASVLMILCQIAIFIIEKFRNMILAILLFVGRICVVGFMWDKTEGLAKGWFMSFLNVLMWPFWLAVIYTVQFGTIFGQPSLISTNSLAMLDNISTLIVFLFLYLQVFNMNSQIFAGNLGSAAASIGSAVTAGLAAKGMIAGAKKGKNVLGDMWDNARKPATIRDAIPWGVKTGPLTTLDPASHPYKINDQAPQIEGQNYAALPAPDYPHFYGDDKGSVAAVSDVGKSDYSNYDEGPTIDADYEVID